MVRSQTKFCHLADKQPKSKERSKSPQRPIRLAHIKHKPSRNAARNHTKKNTWNLTHGRRHKVSRYEYALKLAEVFNLNMDLIKPAKMGEMPWKAKRPKDSSLNISKASTLLHSKPLKLNHALEMMKKEKSTTNSKP